MILDLLNKHDTKEQEAKGCEEFLESYGSEQYLTSDIRSELSEYADEELCTVDAFYV